MSAPIACDVDALVLTPATGVRGRGGGAVPGTGDHHRAVVALGPRVGSIGPGGPRGSFDSRQLRHRQDIGMGRAGHGPFEKTGLIWTRLSCGGGDQDRHIP